MSVPTKQELRLRAFSERTLNILHDADDWGGDELEEIAQAAADLDLACMDDAGDFRGDPEICGSGHH